MRKLFIFISALMLAVTVSAVTTEVAPGTNAIRAAVAAASANDVLVLTTGTYSEDGNFSINKNITIQAAENKYPVIENSAYFKIEGGAQVTFKGIKFDGRNSVDHLLRSHDNSTGEEDVIVENCEFTRYTSFILYTQRDTRRWNTITIRNCYFHNTPRSAVYVNDDGGGSTKQSCNSVTIENTTFADFTYTYPVIYFNAPDAEHTGSLNMNHCTFYNLSYPAVNWAKSNDVTITNCIFAQPSSLNYYSIICLEGSTIDHCLAYNTKGFSISGEGTSSDITGNPYFVNQDPSNYDFSVASFSPAHNAGTDSKNLGDNYHWTSNDAAHPTTQNLSAAANVLKTAVEAAWPGDVIVLGDGEFEQGENYTVFNKNLVIKAAENATPVVKFTVPAQILNGARAEFKGIKFDMTDLYGQTWYEHLIYAYDASDNNRLIFENCEFYNDAKNNSIIYCASDKKLDSLIINNCKFYDVTKSCVFLANTGLKGLAISNSTFYNISTDAGSYYAGVIDARTTTGKIRIDHCTFYDCFAMNADYAIIRLASSDGEVSNSIFAMSSSSGSYRTIYGADGGTKAKNCLAYNYTNDSNLGMRSDVVKTNCFSGNPLFTDAANDDYSFPGNWTTGNVSPARGAATDGSDLGDPRWFTDEVIPSSDIATSYDLMPAKALLSGNIALDDSKIKYSGSGTPGTAKWKLHIENPRYIYAIVDRTAGNDLGCKLTLTIKDEDGNEVGNLAATSTSYDDNDITLPGYVYISEEGDYTLILTNSTTNSGSSLDKITLAYFGGDEQAISPSANTSLAIEDAWFAGCTRDEDGITFTGHSTDWIKWNISTSETKFYDLTLSINATNAHGLTVAIYEDENAAPVASVTEGSYISTTGELALELGRISLSGGKNYVVKITNAPSGSVPEITSLVFAPFIATTVDMPNTLGLDNAVLSARAHLTNGNLYFAPIGDTNPVGEWARWSVTTDHDGRFLFTMGVNSDNSQSYKISILDGEENVVDFCDLKTETGAQTLKHYFQLAAGDYSVKVENTYAWSHGYLTSLVVTEPAEVITLDEAATDNTSWAAKVEEDDTYDVQIIRTIKAGMYNTFCLPFAVDHDQCKDIFGSDVQIRTLDEATVETGDFVLNLNFKNASDIYPGTPVLIQTSRDIVNPVFTGVKFAIAAPSATTKTNAYFVGTFVKTELEANENLLFLGANNKLYFPTASIDMYGMRAYFLIQDAPAGAIKRARIVENEQIATDIELVNSPDPTAKSQKLMENGQLIIIRDGVRYNVMGARVK